MNIIDKYLNLIGYEIQLPDNKREEINKSYMAVSKYIGNNNDLAGEIDYSIYYHGSFAIDTVIKPLKRDDFDLDIIVEFDSSKRDISANQFYKSFLATFEDGKYDEKVEEYRNSVRIIYENNYHFDIMPSVPLAPNSNALSVPDAKKRDWVIRSPKSYIEWFKEKARVLGYNVFIRDNRMIMESEVKPIEPAKPYEMTPTLVRVVQLIKRIKDVYFYNYNGEREPQSIVITTLIALYYGGEYSVYDALKNVVEKMKKLKDKDNRFKVFNPSYKNEEFTEKWHKHVEYYDNYSSFIDYAYKRISELDNSSTSKKAFKELFGNDLFDKIFQKTKYDYFWTECESNIIEENVFPNSRVVIQKKERGNAK